jgi:hypothetical protein
VAPDRVISTVDPEARHGHKTNHRGFDGYKGHLAVDPDAEIITATAVTAGNVGDGQPAVELLDDLITEAAEQGSAPARPATASAAAAQAGPATPATGFAAYGDCAYGAGEVLARLKPAGIDAKCKVQAPSPPAGRFTKYRFSIDLPAQTVTCPAGVTVAIRTVVGHDRHAGKAEFAAACTGCPLAAQCTTAKTGRSITIGHHEALLAAARARQTDPAWQADYRATRPQGRTKDRTPDAATPRRTPRPHARPTQDQL